VRKTYLRWRDGRKEKDRYILLRKKLRDLSRRKKEKWTKKIEEIKNGVEQTQAYKIHK